MIVNIIVGAVTLFIAYQGWEKVIKGRLDSPINNDSLKGLEKVEIKTHLADLKKNKTNLEKEIKDLEKERKDILKGSDSDKNEKAEEKLETKNEKVKELEETKRNLEDCEVVLKNEWSGWKAKMPNKFTLNNGLWIGGFLVGVVVLCKFLFGIFRNLFRGSIEN